MPLHCEHVGLPDRKSIIRAGGEDLGGGSDCGRGVLRGSGGADYREEHEDRGNTCGRRCGLEEESDQARTMSFVVGTLEFLSSGYLEVHINFAIRTARIAAAPNTALYSRCCQYRWLEKPALPAP